MDFLISFKNGLRSRSSDRKQPMKSKTGAWGEQIRSDNKIALSTSPHCRSSIARINGLCSPSRFSSSRKAAKARRLSSCWSGISVDARRASATASTLCKTGKTRARNATSGGSRLADSRAGSPFKCRARASIRLSRALYGTDSRS